MFAENSQRKLDLMRSSIISMTEKWLQHVSSVSRRQREWPKDVYSLRSLAVTSFTRLDHVTTLQRRTSHPVYLGDTCESHLSDASGR